MGLVAVDCPGSAVVGIRWHKPSRCYIAEVGYHNLNVIAPDGTVTTKRIRTTHYLGDAYSSERAEAKFDSIKRDWEGWAHEQRKAYNKESEERKQRGLPPLPRFKPTWPGGKTRKITALFQGSPNADTG